MTTNTLWTDAELGAAIRGFASSTTIAKTRTFALPMDSFPIAAILEFVRYGAMRKFNDAVGGSDKSAADKVAAAELMIDEYKRGILGKRRQAATGADEWTLAARKLVRAMLGDILSPADHKAFRALEAADQLAKLDAWAESFAVADDDFAKEVDAAIEAARAAADRRAALAAKVKIAL